MYAPVQKQSSILVVGGFLAGLPLPGLPVGDGLPGRGAHGTEHPRVPGVVYRKGEQCRCRQAGGDKTHPEGDHVDENRRIYLRAKKMATRHFSSFFSCTIYVPAELFRRGSGDVVLVYFFYSTCASYLAKLYSCDTSTLLVRHFTQRVIRT